MVEKFLEKYQEELITNKIELKEEQDLVISKIKENEKFLHVLDETNNQIFSNFTPREVNTYNKDKVKEIEQYLIELKKENESLSDKISAVSERLKELNIVINEASHYSSSKKNTDLTPTLNNNSMMEGLSLKHMTYEEVDLERLRQLNNEQIIERCHQIEQYILLDPRRARLELHEITKLLEDRLFK